MRKLLLAAAFAAALSPAHASVYDWDPIAANNTTLGGLSVQGSAPANTIDDLFREMMAEIAVFFPTDGLFRVTYSDNGSSQGPDITGYRISTSPAASDTIGTFSLSGSDTAGNQQVYGQLVGVIGVATNGSEEGRLQVKVASPSLSGNPGTIATFFYNSMAITGSLDLSGSAAGQVIFPASQNASSNANTLDDYEESSSCSLGMTFGGSATGVTFGTNICHYTKVGNMATVWAQIALSSNGSGTGTALITGLPFTADAGINFACSVQPVGGFASLTAGVTANVTAGATTVALRGPSTTGSSALTDTNVTDSATFYLTCTYHV